MWTKELFGVEKPIIALVHLRALPGDPYYGNDLEAVVNQARADIHALQEGGVDGLLIADEFSMPYQTKADYVTVAAIAYIVGRLKQEIKVPILSAARSQAPIWANMASRSPTQPMWCAAKRPWGWIT